MLQGKSGKIGVILAAVIFFIAVLAGVLCYKDDIHALIRQAESSGEFEKKQVVYTVRTQTVTGADLNSSYTYSGEVRGRYETSLGFQVGGKILKRNVELGNSVKRGDVLMVIDEKDIAQGLKNCDAQVFAASSQLKLAETNFNRYRELLKIGAISQADFDRARTAFEAAQAGLRQAQAQYTHNANLMDYSALKADQDGIISNIYAEAGQVVGAGQVVMTLVRDAEKEVEINVPENRLGDLRSAGTISVSFWALPGVSIAGRVREISPVADAVSRTYKARISLSSLKPEVKFGMTSSVIVTNEKKKQAIKLPISAVYQTGAEPSVWVVTNNAVDLRRIKIDSFEGNAVTVSEGLKAGDVVVTAGVQKLWKGQAVKTESEN